MDAPPGRTGVRGHPTTGADDQHGVLPVEDKRGANDEAPVAGRGEPQDDHHQVRTTLWNLDQRFRSISVYGGCVEGSIFVLRSMENYIA